MVVFLLAFLSCLVCGPFTCLAEASTKSGVSTELGTYNYWTTYRLVQSGKKICYMGSFPLDNAGKIIKKSGGSYVLVTSLGKGRGEINVSAVGTYKTGSAMSIKIDKGQRIALYNDNNMGWAINEESDDELIAAMQKGAFMYIYAPGTNGEIVYKYSLAGFSAAYKAVHSC